MKTNEAPERIYIHPTLDNLYGICERSCDNDIEYTRTDAFIEKACEKLKKYMYDNLMFQGRLYREEVIDNFVEGFKTYMKVE